MFGGCLMILCFGWDIGGWEKRPPRTFPNSGQKIQIIRNNCVSLRSTPLNYLIIWDNPGCKSAQKFEFWIRNESWSWCFPRPESMPVVVKWSLPKLSMQHTDIPVNVNVNDSDLPQFGPNACDFGHHLQPYHIVMYLLSVQVLAARWTSRLQ